jgi:hypothetical protein
MMVNRTTTPWDQTPRSAHRGLTTFAVLSCTRGTLSAALSKAM